MAKRETPRELADIADELEEFGRQARIGNASARSLLILLTEALRRGAFSGPKFAGLRVSVRTIPDSLNAPGEWFSGFSRWMVDNASVFSDKISAGAKVSDCASVLARALRSGD